MANIWHYLKSLVAQAEQAQHQHQPIIHEPLERSAEERAAFEAWRDAEDCRRCLRWLAQQYGIFLSRGEEQAEDIDFLDTPSAKGFVLHLKDSETSAQEAGFLMDYIRDKVLEQGYKVYSSDVRLFNRPRWVETIQRHYLKPSLYAQMGQEGPLRQKFGNITIELALRDDAPINLKFSAVNYNDRAFAKAESFGKLMGIIFGHHI